MRLRFWRRRGPSEGLQRAEEALAEIRGKRYEAHELSSRLQRVRVRDDLTPLIEKAIRNIR